MKTEKRPFHCLRQSLTGWIGTAVFLVWGGLAAPAAPQAGGSGPAVTVLEPDEGPVGTEVVIRGENFGPSIGVLQGTSGVSFGGVWASPTSWSEGEVRVEVPAGATTGPVVVTVSGVGSEGLAFTVTGAGTGGPAVGTVSPAQGAAGTEVVIRGTDFGPAEGAEQGTAGVSFNGVAGTPASWSEGEIRVAVPEGATAGPVAVTVGGQVSNGVGFTVTAAGAPRPSIVSVSPELGAVGTEVVIRGENFGDPEGAAQGARGVSFNGVWAEPSFWSEGEIRVTVPEGAPGGLVVVAIEGEASNGVAFAVAGPAPVIATVDPTHGPEGTGVVIRGENFGAPIGAAQGTAGVSFGGVWAEPSFWSGTEIRAAVPEGVASGLVTVTVGGQASNGVDFTVTAGGKGTAGSTVTTVSASTSDGEEENSGPAITSLSPEEGAVGASVTVTGTGFGAAQGNSTVSFNGVAGVPTSWSETAIQVPVPEGATSGPVVVTVGDQASPGVPFRVLSRLTLTIDPLSVSERPGDNAANVEVSVSEPVAEDLPVTLHHPEEGTVDHRRDYSLTKMVVIPQGSTLAAATLAVGDDTVYESDETVEIRASARGYGDSKVVTVALRDNDEPLTLTVTPLSRSEREGEREATVTVSVVEPAEGLVRVFLFQQGGNADSNTDYALVDPDTGYALVDPEVWIQPKDTSVTTTLEVIDDTVYEEEETVVLLASTYGYDYADSQEVTVTIEDDDPRITGFSPDSGLPGDSVTISGDRLGGATAVTFAQGENRVAASSFTVVPATEVSAAKVEATVPAGATTGPIEVTTPAATAPSASPFTVLRLFLATSQSRVAEPNGTATLTVSVLKAVPTALTVTLDHPGDGNADPATDYTLSQTVVTIGVGNSSATVELTVTDDASYEKDETIEIRASAEGYLDSEEVTVTLESEDPPPLTLTVTPLSRSEREGEREATVTVSVEEPAEGLVRVFLVQQGGNADRNTDYALVDNEVWIQPAGTLVTTTLEVIDDAVDEEEETVVLLASTYGPDYADSQEVTVRIEDDDTAGVTVTPASLSLTEEGTGTTYQVRLDSEPTHAVTITIDSDNPDLEVDPASLSFGPGNWSTPRAVTVAAAHDDGYDDESGTLTHGADSEDPNYEGIAIDGVTVAVDDNEPPPLTLTADAASVSEPNGTVTLTVTVPEGAAPPADATITLTHSGSASNGTDYTVGTLTIMARDLSGTATLRVRDNAVYEGTKTIALKADHSGYKESEVVEISLIDDELPPLTLTADAASVSEPNGTTTLRVTVPEGAAPAANATITLTHSGSASNGTDYTVGTLTIMARDLSGTATLRVRDDTVYEGTETILLKAEHSNYQASGVVVLTLLDDEQKLMLTVAPQVVSESAPNRQATVTVSVLRAVPEAVEVTLNRRGTAESNDYTLDQTVVTIPAGGTSAPPATLTVVDDGKYEVGETIELWATATASYEPSDRVKILIEDNEPPQPLAVSVNTHRHGGLEVSHLREGEPLYDAYSVTVSVPQPVPAPVVVALNRTGTADEGDDYRLARTVTIPKDMTSVETTLTVVDDEPFEIPETLTLQATTDDDGYVSSPVVTVTIYDDNYSKLTVSAEASTVSEPNGTVRVTASVEEGKELASDATVLLGFGLTATATHKTDFRLTKRLTLPANRSSVSTVLTVIDDGAYEGDERIELLASGDGTSALGQSEILTIQLEDDDPVITDFTPTRGGAGVVVTISGDNLAGATAVRFGEGETSEIEGDSDTEIRATVPAGATTGPITVVTPAGTATSTGIFTVRQLYLEVDPASVGEAAGQRTATVTVRVNEAVTATEGLEVTLAHPGTGKATRDTDYTLVRTVTIANTKTSAPVATLTVVDDGEYEGEETILLQATASDYGASSEVTVTVEDDDPTITDFTPKRGAPGVVVTISGDNFTEQGTTVQFNGVEVEASKVTVDSATEIRATVPPGAATGPITVVTPGGTVASTDPFRVLRLHIQVDPATVKEKAGNRTATVTVSVADAVDRVGGLPVAFTFGGTADRGRFEDYTMDQTVTITAGTTSAEKTLTVRDDSDHEEEETITIQAGANGYESSEVAEVALISDDLPEPVLACPLSLQESHGTEQIAVYLPFTRDVDTDFSFAFKGRATHGTDYTMVQMVTIDAGSTSAEIPLTVIDDRRHEGDETIDLEASADGFQTAFCVFSIEDNDPMEPPLTLSVSPASVGEASGRRTATVTVSVDEAVDQDGGLPVTFTFGGTADRETDPDYAMDQTVTILKTKTSASTTLTVIDDAIAEGDETITITAGATDYSDSEAVTVTIADDDVPGVTVTEASLSITEGGSGTYQVKLDTQPSADVTITITSSDEGAVTVTPASLTFTAGNWNTARAVTVEAVHDDDANDETGTITHTAASSDTDYVRDASVNPGVLVEVTDDDEPGVTVTPTSLSIIEGGSKSYQVKLKTQPSADVTITITSSNSDVGRTPASLTFTAGTEEETGNWSTFQTVTVRIAHDDNNTDESGTITHVAASSDTDYVRGASKNPSVSVSVSDDEPTGPEQLSLSLSPRSRVSEPSGTTTVWVSVPTAVGADTTVTLHHPGTGSGRATHGSDYTLAGSVTITEGGTVATTTLTVVDDALDEPDETIQLYASATDYRDSPTRTVTIVDDDPSRLSLSVSPASVSETGGESTIKVSVPSWAAPSSNTTVTLTHPGSGTATRNSDYRLAGSVTIPANQTSATTTLRAVGDTRDEPNETVRIQASATGYDPSPTRTVTIIDDDNSPLSLSVSPASVSETGGESTIKVSVPSWAAPSSNTTVTLTHPGSGTATRNSDYRLAGSVTIPANQTSATTTLQAVGDTRDEPNETVRIQASATGYDPSPERMVTIIEHLPPVCRLSVSPSRIPETGGISTVTVSVSEALAGGFGDVSRDGHSHPPGERQPGERDDPGHPQ